LSQGSYRFQTQVRRSGLAQERLEFLSEAAAGSLPNQLIISYASRAPDLGLEPVRALAQKLAGVVEWSNLLGRYLLVTPDLTITLNWNHLAPVERAERLTGDGTASGSRKIIAKDPAKPWSLIRAAK